MPPKICFWSPLRRWSQEGSGFVLRAGRHPLALARQNASEAKRRDTSLSIGRLAAPSAEGKIFDKSILVLKEREGKVY
jgi:hypothetical protein